MSRYYVNDNAQSNGDHEVHTTGCSYLPALANRTYLGDFDNCQEAVEEARIYFEQVNGCYFCSYECHTS